MTTRILNQAIQIACSYISNNQIPATDVSTIVASIHAALRDLGNSPSAANLKPAVPIKKSFGDDFIVCLEDGKRLTMLKRYLRSHHGMSPEQYRARWNLPPDYPMVAPAYARLRAAFARKIGLGRLPITKRSGRRKKVR